MKYKLRAALAIGAAAALVAGAAVSAATAAESNGSDQKMYTYDPNVGNYIAPGTLAWEQAAVGYPSKSIDLNTVTTFETFPGSADADSVTKFMSRRGEERDPSKWLATEPGAFTSATSKDVLLPNITPSDFSQGNAAGVKAAGGDYSIGFAFTKNNRLNIATAGVVYHWITVTAGTGAYTFQDPAGGTTPPVDPPVDPTLTGTIDLEATTIAGADGNLSLVIPAGAKATLGAAALVGGLSTSTGALPEFTVSDGRVVSHPGWTLNASVSDFVSGANTIGKAQLGVKPKVGVTSATGVTAGTEQLAGSAVWPSVFAQADNSAAVGDTKLSADLKFVAPGSAPAGTYTSKMTLTLVSK